VPSVSAASIIAKVARDNYMAEQDAVYDGYGFGAHVGYGTAAHRAAIEKYGITPLHRLSFSPLSKYQPLPGALDTEQKMSMGGVAEDTAADYLKKQGHEIIERNWKTKYCEIDIISQKDGVLYFTEVKYRRQLGQGGGLGAITKKKLNKMTFAAKLYAHAHKLSDKDLRLAVISLTSDPLVVENYLVLD